MGLFPGVLEHLQLHASFSGNCKFSAHLRQDLTSDYSSKCYIDSRPLILGLLHFFAINKLQFI